MGNNLTPEQQAQKRRESMQPVVMEVVSIIERSESINTPGHSDAFRLDPKITKAAFGKVGEVVGDKIGSYVQGDAGKRLMTEFSKKVGGTSVAYGAVGIGAIAVCLLLDTIMSLINGPDRERQSIGDILRTVFKDEQAKKIHDLIDCGFQRLQMFSNATKEKQVMELSRIEADLHSALVTVKNTMLVENKWELRYIQAWVHGTFIHALLVLHLAKLSPGSYPPPTVSTTLDRAVIDLQNIHSAWMHSDAPQYEIRFKHGAGGPWVVTGPSVYVYKNGEKIGHANGKHNDGYGAFLAMDEYRALLRPMLCEYFSKGIEDTMSQFETLRSSPTTLRDAGSFQINTFVDQLKK